MTENATVSLREITAETVISIIRLSVAEDQKGFVMLEDQSLRSLRPDEPKVGVWRFMIDAKYQKRGIGAAALRQVIEHVRAKGLFKTLELSYVPGSGSPEPFYLGLGFRHTGRLDGTEVVLELPL